MAQEHADYLGLEYHYHFHGDDSLSLLLKPPLKQEDEWQN